MIVELEDKDDRRGTVTVQDPAIEAAVSGTAPLLLGTDVQVTLAKADVATRSVEFTLV